MTWDVSAIRGIALTAVGRLCARGVQWAFSHALKRLELDTVLIDALVPLADGGIGNCGDSSELFVARPWWKTAVHWREKVESPEQLKRAMEAENAMLPTPRRDCSACRRSARWRDRGRLKTQFDSGLN